MEADEHTNGAIPDTGVMADLDEEIRGRLAAAGRFVTMAEAEYLTVQGKAHHMLAVIISGKLAVSVHAHGDTVQLATLAAGQTVGEMSVIDPRPASATVRVVDGEARLWTIDGPDFDAFTASDAAAGYAVMKVLGKQLCFRLRRDSETMLRRADEMRSSYLDNDY